MNFKYLIFLCLIFIVSIGAVSAADDVNLAADDVSVDSIIIDNPICENAKEYTIQMTIMEIILIMKLVMH